MTLKSVRFVLLVCILISSLIYTPATPVYALSLPAQMNKSFLPISIVPGQTSVLSVTIFNPNAYALTAAHYHDFFPAGISLANPIGLTNSCGGTVTDDSFNPLVPGGTMFRLDGGTVPLQVGATPGQCTVTVNVTSVTPGNLINTIPANELTSDGDDGGVTVHITNPDPASATLQVGTVIAPSLNKTFNIGTIWVGQASQLTINVINNDPTTTLTQTTLTDTLPVPFVLANPLGSSLLNCGGGATLTGPGGIPLAVGQPSITLNNSSILPNTTCRIRVNVTSPTQGIYTNTIPAGPAGLGSIQTQQGVTNASPASAPINVQAVGILKTFTPGTFQAGGTSVLTLTLQNPTGAAYTGVGLADSLVAIPNVTFVGGTTTLSPSCGPGTATLSGAPLDLLTIANATVPSGTIIAPGTCIVTVQVTGTIPGTYTNTIPAGAMTGPITNVLPVSANVTIQARAIGVTKAFVPNNFNPGGTSVLTITLQNRYSTPYTDVQFTDTLPGGGNLTIAALPAPVNNCGGTSFTATPGTNIIRLGNGTPGTGGTIPVGTAPDYVTNPGTCTIVLTVTSNTAAVYNNSIPIGGVTSAGGTTNTVAGNGTLTVNAAGPVLLTKAFQSGTIAAGANVRLRLTMTAPADTALTNFSITDNLPAGVTISNSTAPAFSAGCGAAGNRTLTNTTGTSIINLVLNTLAASTSCQLDVWVTSSTPGTVTNTVHPADITDDQTRTTTANVNANLTVTNLSMTKAFFPPTVNPNGLSSVTITLTNTNPLPLVNVSLSDFLPGSAVNGVVVRPLPAVNGNATTSCTGGTVTAVAGSQTITMANGSIPAQVLGVPGQCTITVEVQGRGVAAPYNNTVSTAGVIGTIQGTATTMRPLANANATLTIAPISIDVVKGFNPLIVTGGASSTLSVQISNPNNSVLSGITFVDNMPAGMIIATPANLNPNTACFGAGATLVTLSASSFKFSGGTLPAAGTCTLTLSATMTVNGNLTNTIPAGAVTTFNGASSPDDASATLTNLPGASISKDFSPNPIYLGSYSSLTITIQNTGNIALSGMGLVDNLPVAPAPGLVVAGGVGVPSPVNNCGGTLSAPVGSQTIQLTGGSLAGSASCTLVISVTSTAAGSYLNTIPASTLTSTEGATNKQPTSDTLVVLPLASLGDFVWNDLNANGIQDAGEPGIPGVTVNLLDATGTTTLATTTTNASGLYSFTNLLPGTYRVGFVNPGGYTFSPADQGANDAIDSDANTSTGVTTSSYTLASGDNNTTIDAGMYQPASLGDFVWNDLNANGIQDAGEAGIPNVTVHLLDSGGTVIATTTTNASGLYSFTNLAPGTYSVQFVNPGGYTFSAADQGANDATDSDADTSTGVTTSSYTLVSGENNTTVDAGLHQLASIGDFVWNDLNANGIQDAGEPGIPGVTVNLLDSGGATIATTTTNGSGLYSFTNLTPGTYSVQFVNPGGYTFSPANQGANDATDSDADTTTGITTSSYTLVSGENNTTVDAGMYQLAALGDFVWNDLNANGIQNAGEAGIPNVTVHLLDSGGATIATTTTDSNGLYHFTNLTPGTYSVQFVKPGGYAFSPANQGANDAVDSDADTTTGITTATYTLTSGENNTTVDAGLYQAAALGDFVWNDVNANGIQDAGETGIPGVTVNLLDATGTTTLATTTTDANGLYHFTNLAPGTYRVGFVNPGGYSFSPADQGANDAADSDANTTTGITTSNYTLAAGDNNITIDAGLYRPAAGLFDPPTGQKVLNALQLPELEWRMVWINNTNVAAINVQITDPIPTNTTYVLNSLTCVANNASVTISCVYDPILNQITWHGHIAADFGVTDPTKAVNSVIITFRVTVPDTLNQVNNQGSSLTDTNGDGRFTDETTQASVAVSNVASWSRNPGSSEDLKSLKVLTLPKTGFAPDIVTVLPPQPASAAYSDEGNIWLEIPRLGLKMPIVGVPFSNGTWDVTWITNQAGWLQGTAFPTHAGNSVLTGHVYKADGTAGPFVNLHNLQYGDIVIVHLDGQSYVYQVREDKIVAPDDTSSITHETYPWLTLITCKDYDAATNTYAHRVAVRAVLISIGNDTPTKSTGGKR